MTTTEDTVSFTPSVRRQPVALCVVVGTAVTLGWVLYRHYWLNDVVARVLRWSVVPQRYWVYSLILALAMCVPYALALLLWGRGLVRAAAGAGVALVAGLVFWGVDHVFQTYVWDSARPTATSVRVYEWSMLLPMALLVPLAWGVARRSGRTWMLGLVVGPVVSAILRELELRWPWWQARVLWSTPDHWQRQAAVYVAPFVLGILACWALEAAKWGRPPVDVP
jgi:hypothetical protein